MKTTIDIPERILSVVLLYSKMKSKKDAIISAMEEYVQKKKRHSSQGKRSSPKQVPLLFSISLSQVQSYKVFNQLIFSV